MITTTSNGNNIKSHGVKCEGSFNIKATGKAFKILSDGLYSDKITAIIRELSCNAYDAHVQAGKSNVPFLVQLPNQFEPVFRVKDTGTGLCHNDVMNLYTTYFESTKNDSNDFIGCLGLGSKSPFSYIGGTSSFNITSNFHGKKRQYSAFINENGFPKINLMAESDTDEENGLEISFNVKSHDFNEFKYKAEKVYRYFKTKPIITGIDDIKIDEIKYSLNGEKWGLRDDSSYSGALAIMGNVCYPIHPFTSNNEDDYYIANIEQKHNINKLIGLPIDFFFEIGELEVAASRETLSYDESTINSISALFKNLVEEINTNVHHSIKNCATLWDARIKISHLMKNQYTSLKSLIKDDNFKWGDVTIEGFSNIVNIPIDLCSEIQITRFSKKSKRIGRSSFTKTSISKDIDIRYIYCDNDSAFLWKDISIGAFKRCTQFLNKNENIKCVYLVSSKSNQLQDKTNEEKLKDLHSFEDFLGTSINPVSSVAVDKTKYASGNVNYKKNSAKFLLYDLSKYDHNSISTAWEPIKIDIKNDSQPRIYVILDRYLVDHETSISYISHKSSTLRLINENMNFDIIGVRSKSLSLIKDKSNWISLYDYVRSKLIQYIDNYDIYNVIQNINGIRELNNNISAKELLEIYTKNYSKSKNRKSPIRSLMLKTKMIKRRLKNKPKNVEDICYHIRGYNIELKTNNQGEFELNKEIDNVFKHYPLIRLLHGVRNYPNEIMHYINAVDMSRMD